LGRTIETRAYENSTQYIAVQHVPFVMLQDPDTSAWVPASQSSNPFRPYLSEQPVWTTTFVNSVARSTKIRTPDNAIARSSYSGNTVTGSDQLGKARKSESDALGRLTKVYEDPNSANWQTSYSYDVLGDLLTVSQGGQTRTFVYDSLKRLTSATNPENGNVSYTYDNNSNLLTRLDARNITTTLVYDALNRPTSKSYNDSNPQTPAVNYFYDAQTLPSGGPSFSRGSSTGRLVAVTYGGSSAGDYFGYDALGRGVLKIQQTGGVNYQTSAVYNRASELTSETYPSARTVTYAFDQAGRTSSVTGTLGDGTSRN
jgi:YD repeat-containing protein